MTIPSIIRETLKKEVYVIFDGRIIQTVISGFNIFEEDHEDDIFELEIKVPVAEGQYKYFHEQSVYTSKEDAIINYEPVSFSKL